jgi:GH15 family glucan-1,4-alpha-glucosidase
MVRAALDESSDLADMQGDASNAFYKFMRRPLFEELSSDPATA